MKRFSTGEALSFGWSTTKANLGLLIGVTVIVVIISCAGQVFHSLPVLGNILSWILSTIISMGLIRFALKFADGARGEFNDLFSSFDMLLDYIGASILYALIVVGGMCLLIVPGIIWAIKFGFYGYFIIDKRCSAVEALKQSAALTRGAKWDIFVFGFACFGVNLLGAIAFGVGLLVTIPTIFLAWAFVYRKLLGSAELAQPAGDDMPRPA